MSHTYPPPEGLGPVLAKGKNQKGFSLVGALTASVIGLMVTYGITHTLVQTKLNTLAIEKRERRRGLYSFVNNVLSNSQSCLNTLKGKALTGNSTDKSFEITALKDENDNNLMDLSKPNGVLDATTKKKLKNMGIDKFEKLEFRYKPAMPRAGQVVLISKTEVKGLHEKNNREIVWELSGIKVETKTNNGESSDQVTLCMDAVPLKVLCGTNANGTGHLNGGGFVEGTATVDSGAFVADTAVVCGNAKVKDNAKVFGNAKVKGNAEIKGNALVYDNAKVSGNAVIKGNAEVYDSAEVYGDAVIQDNVKVYKNAGVYGKVIIKDRAEIYGMAEIIGKASDRAPLTSGVEIKDDAKVFDMGKVRVNAKVYGNATVGGSGSVLDNAQAYGNAYVGQDGTVRRQAQIRGNSKIFKGGIDDTAIVDTNGEIFATIRGNSRITGDLGVFHDVIDCNCNKTTPDGASGVYVGHNCNSEDCTSKIVIVPQD